MNKQIAQLMIAIPVVFALAVLSIVCYKNTDYITYRNYYMERNDPSKLKEYISQVMSSVNAPLSDARKEVVLDAFVRVTNKIFTSEEYKRYFGIVLAMESKFNPDIGASKAGAVGIGQIMPQFAKDFAALCNMPAFDIAKDLKDMEINMTLGACLFSKLIEKHNGNVAAAVCAYNSGSNSLSMKQLSSLSHISNMETASYISRFYYILEGTKLAAIE